MAATGAFAAPQAVNGGNDTITEAAAAILGTALKGSVENIERLGVPVDRNALMKRLGEILDGKEPAMSYDRAYQVIDEYVAAKQRHYTDSVFSIEAQQAFVAAAAKKEGAVTTPSGLVFEVITEGEGVFPALNDQVSVMYVGSLSDGSVFDRTDSPVIFDVARLVPGFTEGLQLMKPGGKYRLVIPSDLAYGPEGIPGDIPPNAALDFTVELIKVIPTPSAPVQQND